MKNADSTEADKQVNQADIYEIEPIGENWVKCQRFQLNATL